MEHKQIAFKAGEVRDNGTFTGYGSVFGNVDSYREIVAPGAFKKSLAAIKAAGSIIPALWQHHPDKPIGGYKSLEEDEHGLRVDEGFLLKDDVALAREAHALMKAGVVTGMSIGYFVRADSYDEKTGIRTLTEVDLREISVVTFPANEEARVDSVKSVLQNIIKAGHLPSLKQFEDFLREVGFSKSQAAVVANGGLSKLLRGEPGDIKGDDVLRVLREFSLTP